MNIIFHYAYIVSLTITCVVGFSFFFECATISRYGVVYILCVNKDIWSRHTHPVIF